MNAIFALVLLVLVLIASIYAMASKKSRHALPANAG
jgi:heme/copper-type cytochrome/quinol oxidase subunit 4